MTSGASHLAAGSAVQCGLANADELTTQKKTANAARMAWLPITFGTRCALSGARKNDLRFQSNVAARRKVLVN
jgi:hypothetical protein